MYAALAIIVADEDLTPAVPAAQRMLGAVTSPRVHVPGLVEFAGGWQEAATLTRALPPPARAQLASAMTTVITDTDEPAMNRQLALAALATAGRHLSDPDRDRFFPVALQAARGDLDSSTDDDAMPAGKLDRFRSIMGDPAFRYDGLLAAAALSSTPGHNESVIDLAYELMPHATPRQANSIASALALLPDDGRALLDPRSLAAHESEWMRAPPPHDYGALRLVSHTPGTATTRHAGIYTTAETLPPRRSTAVMREAVDSAEPRQDTKQAVR